MSPSDAPDSPARRTAFFGRRMGRPLRERQADLTGTLLPTLSLDLSAPAPADSRDLFARPVSAVWMEIGFGGGEHLAHQIRLHPNTGFIGCEPFVNGMAKMLRRIETEGFDAIRLYDRDAGEAIDWLAPASLDRVYLLYPDPWPKKRHWKRRFISADTLTRLARVLKPGAELRFASDIDTYVDWALAHVHAHPDFTWTATRADDWRKPWADWPSTRYEAKALREGRTPAYLTFRRAG